MKYRRLFTLILFFIGIAVLFVSCKSDKTGEVTARKKDDPSVTAFSEDTGAVLTVSGDVTERVNPEITSAPSKTPADFTSLPTVSEDGKGKILSANSEIGPLVSVSAGKPYNVSGFKTKAELDKADAKELEKYSLTRLWKNKSDDYNIRSSDLYMNTAAFTLFESMISDFVKASGAKDIQMYSAYEYENAESLKSDEVTGFSIKLRIYDGKSTYPLNSLEHKATIGGESVTYLTWFCANSWKYGFIYTGLSGSENMQLAGFRFVGTAHSKYVNDNKLTIEQYVNLVKSGSVKEVATDSDSVLALKYIPKSDSEYTEFEIPAGSSYSISGTGEGGFIIAYTKQ